MLFNDRFNDAGEGYANGDGVPDAYAYDTDGINGYDTYWLNTNPDFDSYFESGMVLNNDGTYTVYTDLDPYDGVWDWDIKDILTM